MTLLNPAVYRKVTDAERTVKHVAISVDCAEALVGLNELRGAASDAAAILVGPYRERYRREAPRREIDRLLTEDARVHPAFAMARRAALMAWAEKNSPGMTPEAAGYILTNLRLYESRRGGLRAPAVERGALAGLIVDVYESARRGRLLAEGDR